MMRPDRHFDTLACADAGFCQTLARLEGGSVCVVLRPTAAARLARESDRCSTLGLRSDGRVVTGDVRRRLASAPGATVFNSHAGPYLCRPLSMGASVVVEDLRCLIETPMLPEPWASDPGLPCYAACARTIDDLRRVGTDADWTTSFDPREEDLLRAALRTASLRSQRQSDTALAVAHYLAAHPQVAWVSYPGRADDPANGAARRDLEHGFGPLVSFALTEGRIPPRPRSMAEKPLGCGVSRIEVRAAGCCVLRTGLETPLDVVAFVESFLAEGGAANA